MGCGGSTPPPPLLAPPPPHREPTPLPPDKAEVIIDTAVDEHELSSTEETYPDVIPPPSSEATDVKIKGNDRWFEDDDFNKASDDADLFNVEEGRDDISVTSLGWEVGGRTKKDKHSTKAKPTLKFNEVDDHARKASDRLMDSFRELTAYLKRSGSQDRFNEIMLARAIVVWMSTQRMDTPCVGDIESPRGVMQLVKERRMTYTTCYALLCRFLMLINNLELTLQCAIINGLVKAARYEPGNTKLPTTNWTAVYCGDFGWQIVHPFWICRALFGNNIGGWTKVEADGKLMRQKEKAFGGIVRNTFQDRYFMPKPSEFLYEAFPFQKDWQMVKPEAHLKTKEEFYKYPYLLPPFHGQALNLESEQSCILETVNGFSRIQLKAKTTNAHMLNLQYELFKKDEHDDSDDSKNVLARMVFNSRANEHFIFDVRFPRTGTYKLVIYGGPYKSTALRLCEVLIKCKQTMKDFDLLPLSCEHFGYGPGPVSMEAGLMMPTKPNGLIPVNTNDKKLSTEIKFQIRDDFVKHEQYSASIHGGEVGGRRASKIDGSDFVKGVNDESVSEKKHVSVKITTENQLVITVRLPREGEFGVTIHKAASVSGEQQEKAICNYLVSTLQYHGTFYKVW
ncbi:lim and transglutaminase domain protein ltd-1-like [Mya arenaria]|uniref:lim and transglutaminase domain protein ltd-1-like n=1 Tax=Mya arenaria TaxID=6604 RepID=UPI0022E7CCE1|nr:lim and transglutaminase domain protein ltd-1-like [Mya arenaria]